MNHKTQPCPFCGCSLSAKDESGYYVHPAGQCFLREYEFDDDSIDAWNRRAAAPQAEAAQGVPEGEYKRMFEDAVRSLAAIDEALGIDPDEAGGAAPILEAIEGLQAALKMARETFFMNRIDVPRVIEKIDEALAAAPAPVSEATKDCSCETCRPITMTDMRMVVCDTCGNKRCPHATDHRNKCSGSNEVGQKGSSWEHVKPVSTPIEQPSQDSITLCERIIHAVEGECDGLAITEEQASNILAYLQYGAPMGDMSEAFCIVDNAIGAAEYNEPQGGNLRIVTLRIDMARQVRDALAANQCVHDKGIVGDDGGTPCCPLTMTPDASAPALGEQHTDEQAAFEAWWNANETWPVAAKNLAFLAWTTRANKPQPQAAEPKDRIEALRKGLFEARDAMRVMSNWAKKSDPAGHSWAVHMVEQANDVLNGAAPQKGE